MRNVSAGGDLTLTWVRRTRIGGDSWDVVEVPMGEADESYEIEILDEGVVKRVLNSTGPAVVYAAAEQVIDFGTPRSAYSVRVYQMSAVVGRGAPLEATV